MLNNKFYALHGKRFFDLLATVPAVILLLPFFVIIAFMVRVRLGSPVVFKQKRPGLHERPFTILKFRTMTDARDEDGSFLPDAQRLTRLGAFLRKTSMDELPELFNVLKGDMSLVGPRPLLTGYLPYYTERERLRHWIRPGLTGLSQISGRNYLQWDERLEMDAWYVENVSFFLDVKIILKTIREVLKTKNVAVLPGTVSTYLWVHRDRQRENKPEKTE
ncbi:MAG: sugar transferase [Smithella sp.]|nr:sugar transferase [Smithella sp.]